MVDNCLFVGVGDEYRYGVSMLAGYYLMDELQVTNCTFDQFGGQESAAIMISKYGGDAPKFTILRNVFAHCYCAVSGCTWAAGSVVDYSGLYEVESYHNGVPVGPRPLSQAHVCNARYPTRASWRAVNFAPPLPQLCPKGNHHSTGATPIGALIFSLKESRSVCPLAFSTMSLSTAFHKYGYVLKEKRGLAPGSPPAQGRWGRCQVIRNRTYEPEH